MRGLSKELDKYVERSPRVEMHSHASLYLGGEQIPGQIINLSATGVALKCPVKREVGKTVQVEFFLGRPVGRIRVKAKLVRYEHLNLGFLWGLKFVNLSYRVRARLEGFVKDQLFLAGEAG